MNLAIYHFWYKKANRIYLWPRMGLVDFSVSMLKYTIVESLIKMLHLATGKPGAP